MNDNTKQSIKRLFWSVLITLVNGLITIFNPSTKEAAGIAVVSLGRKQQLENRNENFGGKKVDQWDCCGKSIVMLKDVQGNISYLNKSVGLYRARLNRKIVYIGRAI